MGLRVRINTDNRLISKTTHTDEYMLAITEFNFTPKEVKCLITNAFNSIFTLLNQKVKMLKRVNQELK